MRISRARYSDLMKIIDAQKQIIEDYKRKMAVLKEENERKTQLIRQLERIALKGADDE